MRFAEVQRAAIVHGDGHLQLIACAGSGKTEVVARRVARLLTPTAPNPLPHDTAIAVTSTGKPQPGWSGVRG